MPNRLIKEKSPYLLQHANNPVDWYPWGEEAFQKARDEDKPIFLSIGYSTCYWCHVMEREVFENETIATLMNEKLVCIKVDREEQPDIDGIYMSAVQAINGSGGWPMSVFLTHDLKPFFGGTYFPPDSRYGRPGFPQLVERISELWNHERNQLLESGHRIYQHLCSTNVPQKTSTIDKKALATCFTQLKESFDSVNGGFGHSPKFPRPSVFNALLHHHARNGEPKALSMTLTTLRKMANGGMYDHLGGGFHRYSVDELWRIPHFEKMLYDQAQLVCSYLDAYQLTHDTFYADIANKVLEYILRQMTHPEGGFYSAEDAESAFTHENPHEKEEGVFYMWITTEIKKILGKEAELFCYHFGIEEHGNAPSDPMGVFVDKNVIYQKHTLEETAKRFNLELSELQNLLNNSKEKLFQAREKRPLPHLDDKIITAWNGLMISAFARASQILQKPLYLQAAKQSATFILRHVYDEQAKVLFRRWRDGEARFQGSLQDYSFFIQGLIDLYEASFEISWLQNAITLTKQTIELFWDNENNGFYDSAKNSPTLLVRMKEEYDGAEPTGNSVMALNLLRLGHITANNDWRQKAEQTIGVFSRVLSRRPDVLPQMLLALDWLLSTPKEIIIAGDIHQIDTQHLVQEVNSVYMPNRIILLADGKDNQAYLAQFLPFMKTMKMIDNKTTVFVCENFACNLPTSDITVMRQLLNNRN